MSPTTVFIIAVVSAAGAAGLVAHLLLSAGRNFFNFWEPKFLIRRLLNEPRIKRLALQAGKEKQWTVYKMATYKQMSLLAALLILFLLPWPREGLLMFGLLLFPLAWWWPELYLKQQAVRQERALKREWPRVIDLIRLYVAAGSNLEQALRRAGRSVGARWGQELNRASARLDLGWSLDEVLEWLKARFEFPEFSRTINAIRQSQRLGVLVSATLAVQARLSRARRQQTALEEARTAAVKIALPLVLCIFPALLIIYLAPAVLRIIEGL